MPFITSRSTIIDRVDTVRTRRALRRCGFELSVREFCALVDAGHTPLRTRLTSQLLGAGGDEAIEGVLVAAYSGYLAGWIAQTARVELAGRDLWAIGLEVLCRAVRASAGSDGGDFHIVRSARRDFCRAVAGHRSAARGDAAAVLLLEAEPVVEFLDVWSVVAIWELVEWLATEFDGGERVARVLVATRVFGFPLGDSGDDPTRRSRNCRDRQRLEAQVRGFVSPAEGLAANVLQRAS